MADLGPYEEGRECSSHLESPVTQEGRQDARFYVSTIRIFNNQFNVVFRSCYRERDILRHVFRWTRQAPEEVFVHGFRSSEQGNTPNSTYYNLERYVNTAGAPLLPPTDNYVFISTTRNSSWVPQTMEYADHIVYRYEIYAPGGILVRNTLGDRAQYDQNEVAFVRGIHTRFIRSVQRFRLRLSSGGRYLHSERVDIELVLNPLFNPAAFPERLLNIERPVDYYYIQEGGTRRREQLEIDYCFPQDQSMRNKRDAQCSDLLSQVNDWYSHKVFDAGIYITSAFRSSDKNQVYLFMGLDYVLVDYAPGTKDDKILRAPGLISEGFTSLAGTIFSQYGIDASFASRDKDEAYIFCDKFCARIDFAPNKSDDRIIEGPMAISEMFPFFKETEFRDGVDAAFDNPNKYEAYIFRGSSYALINYKERRLIGGPKPITDGFSSFKNTIFESGIHAAFSAHVSRPEAYIFKGEQYALINFAPGTTNDYFIGGPKSIKANWPSLNPILPRRNGGPDAQKTIDLSY